jgi:hypothetical protein
MSIYRNGPEAQLAPPDHAPGVSQPLIRPIPFTTSGLRAYCAGEWEPGRTDAVTVTETGYWFHTAAKLAEDAPIGSWRTCRGCGTVATGSLLDPQLGRCAHPASAQDIASALLASQRPAPAEMHSRPRIRFIRTAVAA